MANEGSMTEPLRSELVDDPEMAELVSFFVEETERRIEQLRGCWEQQDFEELCRMAHQLKGASGGYGFPTLGTAAAALELLLKKEQPDMDNVQGRFDDLLALCTRVQA